MKLEGHQGILPTCALIEGDSCDAVQDFGGFRVIVLLPRFKPGWVAPGTYQEELPKRTEELGAPKSALPVIMPNGKPICSATIRAGPGYLEVPFFATQETRRRKGYGRGLLQV